MSSDATAIRVEGLSKSYTVGVQRKRHDLLSKRILEGLRGVLRRSRSSEASTHWALRDISLEIKQGDVVALIGHNGAGKSTLLKILANITEPTSGFAELRGRVGSLLEVGTGFHPELTGRENVYLNGAILGMSRVEIARDFDEIVAFAEVEKFIDTPVKHYSSGMHMRLAFSVATQLRPEILLIDEVLAVGDAYFQRKCLQRIQDVGRSDRTIIFVSHNMAAIRSICRTAIELQGGEIVARGEVASVVDAYLSRQHATSIAVQTAESDSFRLENVELRAPDGAIIKPFEVMQIRVRLVARRDVAEPGLVAKLLTANHERITGLDFWNFGSIGPMSAGETRDIGFDIEALPLLPGTYFVEFEVKTKARATEQMSQLFPFEVAETPVFGTRKPQAKHGSIALRVRVVGGRSD